MHETPYSALERAVHRVAFATRASQLALADLEDRLFAHVLKALNPGSPVFVTSLPRAGTTVLLETLSRLGEMASHRYRDMPFVLAPLLWSRLSGPFLRPSSLAERAHGDGMQVGFDSPEAFEEVLWRAFRQADYRGATIRAVPADAQAQEFLTFFRAHMRKIVLLRAERAHAGRYLSKNNANIARLGFLRKHFPDAAILVPFRNPIDHAASLLRQHRHFTERHAQDAFGMRYMADIGHFEFGALHRRLGLPGVEDAVAGLHPSTVDYWLSYWWAAFAAVFEQAEDCDLVLISHERLCARPDAALQRLGSLLALSEPERLTALQGLYEPPRHHAGADAEASPKVLARAESLHELLLARAFI